MRLDRHLCFLIVLLPMGALAHVDPRADCLNSLRHLDGAKAMLALEHKLEPGEPVEPEMLKPYLLGGSIPRCLAGGHYTIGPIGIYPVCSIAGHSEAAFKRGMEDQARNERILFWLLIGSGSAVTAWVTLAALAAWKKRRWSANNGGAANGSQPIRSETNPTQSAAGSRR